MDARLIAEELVERHGCVCSVCTTAIEQAILSAEREATEREKERCAKVADDHYDANAYINVETEANRRFGNLVVRAISTAIRGEKKE